MHTKESPRWHACIHFCLLAFCLTAPGKWKNFTGSPFGFLFHDSGYRESFLQVPKAHVSLEHYLSNTCGWLECLIFPSFFTSEVTWHNTGNLMLKRWILSSQQLPILFLNQKWMNGFCSYIMAFKCNQRNSHLCCSYSKLRQQLFLTLGQE